MAGRRWSPQAHRNMNTSLALGLHDRFREAFGGRPLLFRSPGRINLIGEHTDYNEGYVLPAAIGQSVYVAIAPREDDGIRLHALSLGETFATGLSGIRPSGKGWPDYILGVVDQLKEAGLPVRGFDMSIDSDLPVGAGVSSSAALSCATVFALDAVNGYALPRERMIRMAQLAEHRYAGVMCGIMDQFASMFGRQARFMRLDCRSMEFEYIPFSAPGMSLLLLNSNVKHSLASSAYNTRRNECAAGLELVRREEPAVQSLRDVTVEMLERWVLPTAPVAYRRCRYVVEENGRLLELCRDLEEGDLRSAGRRMLQTHAGLRDGFEVSCPELDILVELAAGMEGVLGARMMGGGFGGCTINIVQTEALESLVGEMRQGYLRRTGRDLAPYVVEPGPGTGPVHIP